MKQETKKLMDFEAALLLSYKTYLEFLEITAKSINVFTESSLLFALVNGYECSKLGLIDQFWLMLTTSQPVLVLDIMKLKMILEYVS